MMTEIDYLIEISEKLSNISDKLDMLVFIGVFAIFIHYGEKWLKIALNANSKSGRIN